jgi:acetyltransferase-like isoleucine patch superfamily enzyme
LIHPTAIVDATALIGEETKVWAFAQIREKVRIGRGCTVGNGAYIDTGVHVGDRVQIHNRALLYRPLRVEDDVFIGPGVIFANDKRPKAGVIRDLTGVSWVVRRGASIGAGAVIMPDVTIGEDAVVGAGAVVTADVPARAVVAGVPARPLHDR